MNSTTEKSPSEQLIEQLQAQATRSNGKCLMPRKVAIEILKANGAIEESDKPSCVALATQEIHQ